MRPARKGKFWIKHSLASPFPEEPQVLVKMRNHGVKFIQSSKSEDKELEKEKLYHNLDQTFSETSHLLKR